MKFRQTILFIAALCVATVGRAAQPAAPSVPVYRDTFFKLCDRACTQLAEDALFSTTLKREHYKDAYSVRALAVAYDLTGDRKFLSACQAWSDKMIKCQEGMTPKGAYYMNYHRKPGETTGNWYTADSSSIAMGILATAARTADPLLHEKYVGSVRQFADLVLSNYVRDGGITDGLWSKFDGPWWCSTGTFGSLAFLLYDECGDHRYLDAGLAAVDWLNHEHYDRVTPYDIGMQGDALIMYYNEAYSAGFPHIAAGTERFKGTMAHVEESLKWMEVHRHGNSGGQHDDYNSQWGSKAGGLPFHQLIWSKWIPESAALTAKADDELDYICAMIFDEKRLAVDRNHLSQLMNFTMMSLAERLSPGSIYRR